MYAFICVIFFIYADLLVFLQRAVVDKIAYGIGIMSIFCAHC